MKLRNLCFFLCVSFSLPLTGFSVCTVKDQKNNMASDLDVIKNTFAIKYAPAEWKKTYANWDLEEQIALAKKKVNESKKISVKDYQRILQQFFTSTRDYHVGVHYFSTEVAILPFRVASANGKYFISWIETFSQEEIDSLSAEEYKLIQHFQFPFTVGDEIVEFDGKPVDQVIHEMKSREFGNPESGTDQLLAESALTMRLGTKGQEVPNGPVKIVVRKSDSGELLTFTTEWIYLPEKIQNGFQSRPATNLADLSSLKNQPLSENPVFHKQRHTPYRPSSPSLLFVKQ